MHGKWLKDLGIFSLEKTKQSGEMIVIFTYVKYFLREK